MEEKDRTLLSLRLSWLPASADCQVFNAANFAACDSNRPDFFKTKWICHSLKYAMDYTQHDCNALSPEEEEWYSTYVKPVKDDNVHDTLRQSTASYRWKLHDTLQQSTAFLLERMRPTRSFINGRWVEEFSNTHDLSRTIPSTMHSGSHRLSHWRKRHDNCIRLLTMIPAE